MTKISKEARKLLNIVKNIPHYFSGKVNAPALPKGTTFRISMVFIILISVFITTYLIGGVVRYFLRAQVSQVTMYFLPNVSTLPPDRTFSLMINSGSNVIGYIKAEINFDPQKLKLADEINTSNLLTMDNTLVPTGTSGLPADICDTSLPCIIKTPASAANSAGKAVIIIAKDPRNTTVQAATGTFEVLNFTLQNLSSVDNDATTVTLSVVQVVNMDSQPLSLNVSVSPLTLTLNPASATLTPSPTVTLTPSPTNTPTDTPTATLSPTNTPSPTPQPSETPLPTQTPTGEPGATITELPVESPTIPPTATPVPVPGDITGDGFVNLMDYSVLFSSFGLKLGDSGYDPRANIAGNDNAVNLLDYSVLFANFSN